MQHLSDDQRASVLGLNAARIFKFDVNKLIQRRNTTNN
jgi:hypothetical protein